MSDLLILAVSLFAPAVFINYRLRKIIMKVVYYGPGTGPLENLQHIHGGFPNGKELRRVDDSACWFLPLPLESVRGFEVEMHLYTASSGAAADPELDLVLKGTDGIVFIADARLAKARVTAECFSKLKVGLAASNNSVENLPFVLQVVGSGEAEARSLEETVRSLNVSERPVLGAHPPTGVGVLETLTAITNEVLAQLNKE